MKRKFLLKIILFILLIFIINISEVRANEIIEHEQNEEGNIITGYIKQYVPKEKSRQSINRKFSSNFLLGEPTFDSSKRYYYEQITQDVGRDLYGAMLNDNSGTGVANIDLNDYTYKVEGTSRDEVAECFNTNICPYIFDGIVAFIEDNPDRYWYCYDFNITYTYNIDTLTNIVYFKDLKIESLIEEKNNKTNFDNKVREVAGNINGSNTYDTLKQIHDYICKTVKYEELEGEIDQTAYGSLMLNKAVCEGQAGLFEVLCREKGLICIMVGGIANTGTAEEYHAWNYVYQPNEKKWYAVDVTWDNHSDGSTGDYNYFMVGSNTMNNNMTFGKSHIQGMKSYAVQTYIPTVPILSVSAYDVFETRISVSEEKFTNKDVEVRISANKELNPQDGWILSEDKLSIKKVYDKNQKETITVESTRGEKSIITINIDNIDKNPPVISGVSNNDVLRKNTKLLIDDENAVTITLIRDGVKVEFVSGGVITADGYYSLKVVDVAGNATEINFKMEKEVRKDDIQSSYYNILNENIEKIEPGTLCKDFKEKLTCGLPYTIRDENNEEVPDDAYIGTYDKVVVETGREYNIIVYGDTDGNGEIDLKDIAKAQKVYLELTQENELEKIAYDLDGNGNVELKDIAKLQKAYLELMTI